MRRLLPFVAILLSGCLREPPPPPLVNAPPVRITQFYAEPVVPKGEKANLCYGVENAKTVRLDPPVESVWPAVARCFPVDPAKASKYTLTAEDAQGRSVSNTVDIRVGPPRARIKEVSINKTEVKAGEEVTLCFVASNASSVDAGPGEWFTTRSNDKGCLHHRPFRNTTYQVRITGPGGQTDAEQVTVRVRP